MEKIRFEKMATPHIADIALLEKVCFSEPWSVESLKAELKNRYAYFFVATCGQKLLGYIGSHCYGDECYLTNIAIFPEFQRQKIGSALLEFFIDYMKTRCKFISLEVRESNLTAIKLYEKFTFQKIATRKDFYRKPQENALIYTLFFD